MKKHPLICVTLLMTFLYIFLFILIPLIQPFWRDADNTFFPSLLIVFGVGMFFISDKLSNWFLSGLLYIIFVVIYHGNGLYGIGMVGINLDDAQSFYREDAVPLGIVILAIIIFLSQLLIWMIVKIIKFFIRLLKQKNTLPDNE